MKLKFNEALLGTSPEYQRYIKEKSEVDIYNKRQTDWRLCQVPPVKPDYTHVFQTIGEKHKGFMELELTHNEAVELYEAISNPEKRMCEKLNLYILIEDD